MKQNLINEIYVELEIIRILSRLSKFAAENESECAESHYLKYIFSDIEKRCWNITENIEKIERR